MDDLEDALLPMIYLPAFRAAEAFTPIGGGLPWPVPALKPSYATSDRLVWYVELLLPIIRLVELSDVILPSLDALLMGLSALWDAALSLALLLLTIWRRPLLVRDISSF